MVVQNPSCIVPDPQVLKIAEEKLQREQVENWQNLYDEEYHDLSTVTDQDFNIGVWIDSFTGKPIPNDHMREWLDDIVQIILREKIQYVVEIGCGTGLIYYQLTDHLKTYIG